MYVLLEISRELFFNVSLCDAIEARLLQTDLADET